MLDPHANGVSRSSLPEIERRHGRQLATAAARRRTFERGDDAPGEHVGAGVLGCGAEQAVEPAVAHAHVVVEEHDERATGLRDAAVAGRVEPGSGLAAYVAGAVCASASSRVSSPRAPSSTTTTSAPARAACSRSERRVTSRYPARSRVGITIEAGGSMIDQRV